jgi:IS605 OrfB family transposase
MFTIKIKYKNEIPIVKDLMRQYSYVVRRVYNLYKEDKYKRKEIYSIIKQMNNIDLLDSWFLYSAIEEGKSFYKKSDHVIFGSKKDFKRKCKNLISNTEWKEKRLLPIYSISEKQFQGNRKIELKIIDDNIIVLKLKYKNHIDIELPNLSNNNKKLLFKLEELSKTEGYLYTIRLDQKYIYISFEEFKEKVDDLKQNRFIGIDLNPSEIGISINEWSDNKSNILETYKFDLFKVLDNENKLNYEVFEISKRISELSKHFKCKFIFIEDLSIKSKNHEKGKDFNRKVNNQWKRNKFIDNLTKRCNIYNQKLFKINPAYSSVIGNCLYDFYDSVNASIEIARRGYEVIILRNKKFYPEIKLKNSLLHLWKETGEEWFSSWKELYSWLKNSKIKYRVSTCLLDMEVFSLNTNKSLISISKINI